MKQYKVGIIGATGMVGQRFSLLLVVEIRVKPMLRLVKTDGK